MKTIRFECKRALSGTMMKISLLIGIGICVSDTLLFCSQFGTGGDRILLQAWIGTDYQFAYNTLFYVLLPLLACMPYAGSYFSDIYNGYDKNICIRTSRGNYALAKGIAIFVSGFLSVSIPLLVNLFICAGLYPNHKPERLGFLTVCIMDNNLFPKLFSRNQLAYCLVFILIDGIIAGILGLISLCVTKWVASNFTAVAIPFVIYILTGVIFLTADGHSLSIMEMANPVQRYVTKGYQMILICTSLFLFSALITWLWSRKRDII